jgi:ubiquinone/menaquinone biosynthesis C-methylase UbiE
MNRFKPGEFRITKKAIDSWKLPKGAAVLDIGCGLGDTMEYLEKEYGYTCTGIDLSMERIKEAKARNSELNISYGDGEFLDGFSSFSFDGVTMECVLSVINMPDEALHEAFCVLKKGGKLFVSDLYIKDPEEGFVKALKIETERQSRKPHKENECGDDCADDHKNRMVDFRSSGRFLIEPLIEQLKEIGYQNISWEDCSTELDSYAAEKLMRDGTLEGCLCDEALHPKDQYKTGYFMLTADKPL